MKALFTTLAALILALGVAVASGIVQDYGTDWRAAGLATILLLCTGGSSWVLFRCSDREL